MKNTLLSIACAALIVALASPAAHAAKTARKTAKQPTAAFARMDAPQNASIAAANSDAERYYNKLSAPAGH